MHPVQAAEYINCANLQHQQLVINGERRLLVDSPQHHFQTQSLSISLVAHAGWLALATMLLIVVLVVAAA